MNAEKVFASEIAKSQGWQAQRGKRFDSGLTCMPAKATQLVIASQLDLESMHPLWEAVVVEFPAAPSLEDVKQHFGGLADMIANTSAVRVADDSCLVRFSDQMLGVFGPSSAAPLGGALGQAAGLGGPSYASQNGGWAYGAYGRALGSSAAYGWARNQGPGESPMPPVNQKCGRPLRPLRKWTPSSSRVPPRRSKLSPSRHTAQLSRPAPP